MNVPTFISFTDGEILPVNIGVIRAAAAGLLLVMLVPRTRLAVLSSRVFSPLLPSVNGPQAEVHGVVDEEEEENDGDDQDEDDDEDDHRVELVVDTDVPGPHPLPLTTSRHVTTDHCAVLHLAVVFGLAGAGAQTPAAAHPGPQLRAGGAARVEPDNRRPLFGH